MAATRKLQGEIDRCLKKVTEGVETFEDIWQKVHNATNSNQKEKYEADLKKEIKKLQRLRDQIKSWIASGEIKDKSALLENRRLIETQMERFKVVERETKTKAYSKEGLGAAQKMDPAQREKEEISAWLASSISSLQIQIDQFECEIESLIAGKKKKLDKDKQEKMDELKGKLERHKFHVTKLETLLRMLDNESVDVDQIKKIKEDVEYYIDSSQEPDFEENEYIYDDIIGLDEVEISGIGASAGTESNNSNETAGSPSSLISGNSPPPSPVMNCSASTALHNHSGDVSASGNVVSSIGGGAALDADKRPKDVKITPIKPTAIRATSGKMDLSLTTTAIVGGTAVSLGAGANNASSNNTSNSGGKPGGLISSTPSKNHTNAAAVVAGGVVVPNSSGIVAPQQPPGVIVQPLIGPAFAAVAKQHPKNGSLHQSSVSASSTTSSTASSGPGSGASQPSAATVAPNASGATVSNLSQIVNASQPTLSQQLQQAQQQQQQQQTSLASSLLTNAAAVVAGGIPSAPQTQQQQVAGGPNSIPLPHGGALTSASAGIENNHVMTSSAASTINNCVSPSNSAVSSSRASPSLMSPPQQQQQQQQQLLNGPAILAQEVINRTGGLDASQSPATGGALIQQQQQQQPSQPGGQPQPPTAQQQPQPQPDTRQPGGATGQQQPQAPQQQQQQPPPFSLVDPAAAANSANSLIPTSSSTAISNGPNAININTSTSIVANPAANPNVLSSAGGGGGGVPGSGGMKTAGTNEAHIPPLLGVAPLGPSPLQKEHQIQFQMMEAAYYHLPTPSDSERLRTYLQRQPVPTPQHYPQQQLPHSDTVEFFQRLSPETLFFVFYYMEGTKAQYLAAKALKKQSWRFHTKYMMWFQRHEEPKIINEEFEQGTYIYFDYEKWGQRKKEGFTFEYKYLEDRDLN